jgi:hypothetical protein
MFGVVAMLLAATAASVVIIAIRHRSAPERPERVTPQISDLEASIAHCILAAGGDRSKALQEKVREISSGEIEREIDLVSWGDRYSRLAPVDRQQGFLERIVSHLASGGVRIPRAQYMALLDFTFALGLRTDVLSRLSAQYGFRTADYADARQPAERLAFPRPVRENERRESLDVLGLAGEPTRAAILAAYRKAAATTHPDRFHRHGEEAEQKALKRFLMVVRAAEFLLGATKD